MNLHTAWDGTLNIYAKVNTYIVPLEFLEKRVNDFIPFLKKHSSQMADEMNSHSEYKSNWLENLLKNEEFLLCEQNNGEINGIAKKKTDTVKERTLVSIECQCYKAFFDWIRSWKDQNNKEIFLLEEITPTRDFPVDWNRQIEEKIEVIRKLR